MTRCKVCASPHRGYIEEQLANGLSARSISKLVKVMFDESISHTAIANHVKHHLNSDSNNSISQPEVDLEALEARVRNLEREVAHKVSNDPITFWNEYGEGFTQRVTLTRQDLFLDAIPNPEDLKEEEAAMVQDLREATIRDRGFCTNRDEIIQKRLEAIHAEEDALDTEEELDVIQACEYKMEQERGKAEDTTKAQAIRANAFIAK